MTKIEIKAHVEALKSAQETLERLAQESRSASHVVSAQRLEIVAAQIRDSIICWNSKLAS